MSQIEAISTLSALKQALEALEYIDDGANNQGAHTGISWRCVSNKAQPAITSLRQAIDAASQLTEAAVAEQHEKQSTKCVEQGEPVALVTKVKIGGILEGMLRKGVDAESLIGAKLYTTPYVPEGRQQRTWVGLTDEEVSKLFYVSRFAKDNYDGGAFEFYKAAEAKLREKNSL